MEAGLTSLDRTVMRVGFADLELVAATLHLQVEALDGVDDSRVGAFFLLAHFLHRDEWFDLTQQLLGAAPARRGIPEFRELRRTCTECRTVLIAKRLVLCVAESGAGKVALKLDERAEVVSSRAMIRDHDASGCWSISSATACR
jgi:hypothetical protein